MEHAKNQRRTAATAQILAFSQGKKTQWVGWTLNLTEWRPVKKWLPDATQANFLFAQETRLPKAIGNEESRMWSQGWRASIMLALCRWHGEWESNKQTARSTGSAGVMVAAAMRHVLATPCGAVQGPRACAVSQWHCSRRGAALFGVSAHRSRSHTRKLACAQLNWPMADVPCTMPFIMGSDIQVETKQLDETPKLATMNPSHCVVDCFFVCRDLALPELAQVSIAVPPPVVVSPLLVRCHLQYQ